MCAGGPAADDVIQAIPVVSGGILAVLAGGGTSAAAFVSDTQDEIPSFEFHAHC